MQVLVTFEYAYAYCKGNQCMEKEKDVCSYIFLIDKCIKNPKYVTIHAEYINKI